jgi:N-acetylneuraminate synthase
MKKIYIIAEAGVNHNGSPELAERLIAVAAEAGADAVKFQTFHAENLVSRKAPMAAYQQKNTGLQQSQWEMLKKLELSEETHRLLQQNCIKRGIEFLSTPFDEESLDFLVKKIKVKRLKVPSGEITNAPFLLQMAKAKKPTILSTGMSTLEEVQTALAIFAFGYVSPSEKPTAANFNKAFRSKAGRAALKKNLTLLHCTSEYPAPFGEVNLRAMKTLHEKFGLPVGLSDHTLGIAVPIAAAALGATVIEKHFTLDRNLPGPDHKASLEPSELAEMVRSIREVEMAMGSPQKKPTASERKNRAVARRSLVASRDIRRGEPFHEGNLTLKRPADGVSPLEYWNWLGKKAGRSYLKDEAIKP